MYLAKVVGVVVATTKSEQLIGSKILVVQPIDPNQDSVKSTQVAVDAVGAGVGETVLVASGSSARKACGKMDAPIDSAIVGIVDSIEISG